MIILRTVKNFSALNVAASILLFLTAILAAIVANSSLAPVYQSFLSQELHLRIGDFNLLSHGGHNLTMIEFINDCLMTIFFLAVGLEIKRELLVGELSSFRKAILPFIAACGGMIFPVLVYYFLVTPGTPETQGMAIPMATDIAFSLGVLSLLGKRVPLSLKIFLTAFAVVDDIGGILVIAIFYSSEVAYGYLIVAAILYTFLYYMGKFGMTQKIFFLFFGIIIWYLFLQSGIHSTISGVILAFVIPARPRLDAGKYIRRIRAIVSSFPVVQSDNIVLTNEQIATLKQVERASAVGLGLLWGKFLGIYLFTWLTIKSGLARMPEGMNWKNIAGVSLLGGVGFTVSLFIANLSFSDAYPELLNQAKFGVLCGTIIAGILGYVVLNQVLPKKKKV